jgi:cell division topological specificity factor
MAGFIDWMLGRTPKGSGATAKQRLQFVLVHDRINLPPEKLQAMKQEILEVISKYVNIDLENVDIALQQGDRRGSMLVAEIPFNKIREEAELDDPELLVSHMKVEQEDNQDEQENEAPIENTAEAPKEQPSVELGEDDKTQPHRED